MAQQFMVPQFIDVEDKIIGPVTTRQFVIMLAAVLVVFLFYKLFSFVYFVFGAFVVLGIAAVLAFALVNGRPVHYFLLNFLQTSKRPHLRIWNKTAYEENVNVVSSAIKEVPKPVVVQKDKSKSRLSDLTLIVNTGGVYEEDK
ncbi:MAG: PrgI family protein [Parcubacteria group bacterium]